MPDPLRRALGAAALALVALSGDAALEKQGTGALDWNAVAGERVPVIVTRNADGSLRETKLWIVVVDGQGYIRTSNTRWFRNIERDPEVELRIGGATHLLRAERLRDPALVQRVVEAFRAKYGFWDWLVSPFRSSDPKLMRLVPRS